MSETRSYKNDLLKALADPTEAREYLNAALEDEDREVFLLALQDVFEANHIASKLTEKDDLQLNNIRSLLNKIGFKLAVEVN